MIEKIAFIISEPGTATVVEGRRAARLPPRFHQPDKDALQRVQADRQVGPSKFMGRNGG
jgi:hypothetical protein